jgi:hypothetical protein
LSRQAERAAAAHGPSQVVITSMTRTAAHEIASRTPDIPEDQVGTLHAHAYRALDRPDLAETPEAIREWNAEHPALELTTGAAWMTAWTRRPARPAATCCTPPA